MAELYCSLTAISARNNRHIRQSPDFLSVWRIYGGIVQQNPSKSRQNLLIVTKLWEAGIWLASLLRVFYGDMYLVIPHIPSCLHYSRTF
jgi:hypothetical protein